MDAISEPKVYDESLSAAAQLLFQGLVADSPARGLQRSIEHTLNQMREVSWSAPYHHLQRVISPEYDTFASEQGEASARNYLRLLLLQATVREGLSDSSPSGLSLPASIRELQREAFARIVSEAEYKAGAFYRPDNDLYLKDLSIATHRLVPCGAELLQPWSGIPRSLIVRGGPRQAIAAINRFLIEGWGFRNYGDLHMDPRHLSEFSPQGWIETYLRIADLHTMNPELQGFFGTAWFYDPAMADISPHLAYLREIREQGGAVNFRYGTTPGVIANATSKSRRRRQLYEAGHYKPSAYYLVWPRAALLDWADTHRRSEQQQNQ